MRSWQWAAGFVLAVAFGGGAFASEDDGFALYVARCAPCHGATRGGDGPDASIFMPRPRPLDDAFVARYDTAQLVRMIRDGQALPLTLDPEAMKKRADEVDLLVAHLHRLPDIDWDAFTKGEHVFFNRCQECHGPLGEPGALPPGRRASRSLASADLRAKPRAAVLRLVRHDGPGLPKLPSKVSDADAAALADYVRELTPGFALFARFCASCHGLDGQADSLVDPGQAPRIRFDRGWLARTDSEHLQRTAWHMLAHERPAMPHFRMQLSEPEARAIVDWLRRPATARP
jgi:mono/diheme cytochrome c family protein